MIDNEDKNFAEWLEHRRATETDDKLTDRIMAAIESPACVNAPALGRRSIFSVDKIGPVLLWTAASLVFVVRVASLVGNFAFPTESYPEFAVDQRIEEPSDEHRNVSRS